MHPPASVHTAIIKKVRLITCKEAFRPKAFLIAASAEYPSYLCPAPAYARSQSCTRHEYMVQHIGAQCRPTRVTCHGERSASS
eukprot:scaffold25149_cov23-Prasinocladus_malaysianus.AAC.1